MKTKIIVVLNEKGGVGKSVVAFHLAHAALKNPVARVLCVDMDTQGNLSQYLTGDFDVTKNTEGGAGLLFENKPVVPTTTTHPQIDLLHGHERLDRYDSDSVAERVATAPEKLADLRTLGYDYIIVDTPGLFCLRQAAPLEWADTAILPVEPSLPAITGFQKVIGNIEGFIHPINPSLKWFGVVNRANMRTSGHRGYESYLRSTYGKRILATLGTRSAVQDAVQETPAVPVWLRRGAPAELRTLWQGFCAQALDN
jgi:chromosome partitioning protein